MKYAVLIFLLLFSLGGLAQKPESKSNVAKKPAASKAKPEPTPTPLTEKEQFDKASSHELAVARVAALEDFLTTFPQSEHRPAASDLLASSRAMIADEKLLSGDAAGAAADYKRLIEELPQPIPSELFTETIARIPSTLFRRGERAAAAELAVLIENRVENDPVQLIALANFYLSVENGAEAMRVAAKAAAKDPASAAVQRTLALAHRINFDLELSADSYAKALELDPESAVAKRGLAEMKRALGKSTEAVALYRELLAKNEGDGAARTGLVLALFDADKRTEAEAELAKALEKTPGNVVLLAGAAYSYASRGVGDKAVELAQKAIEREPRYVWSHIALARGLMIQGKPVAAEQSLIKARAYGNFPTLEYELASARVAAGFFREAADDLAKHFSVSTAGVKTRLGGRLAREEKSLADLVAYERRASIFAPHAADTAENSAVLKALLDFDQKLRAAEPNEAELAAAADVFAGGNDKMKIHRQIYAAESLLQKRVAIGKVLELTKAATGNTDTGLGVADPAAAVMAAELYEPRAVAFRRNDFLLVPEVPKQTLSAILRGRIEEITGWALYQQSNFPDAIVRLRRAISVMPDNSAWWRSSMWRLGAALAADGKDADALNAYIDSYRTDKPDFGKFVVVEALYKKVHGTTEGLEAKIGSDHVASLTPIQNVDLTGSPAPTPGIDVPASGTSTEVPASNPAAPPVSEPTPVNPAPESPKSESETKALPAPEKTETEIPTQPEAIKAEPEIKTQTIALKNEPELTRADPEKTETEAKTEPAPPKAELELPAVEKADPEKTESEAKTEPAPLKTELELPAVEKPAPPVVDPSPVPEPPAAEPKTVESRTDPAVTEEKTKDEPGPTQTVDAKPPHAPEKDEAKPPVRTSEKPDDSAAVTKSLFEPIIITIPSRRPPKPKPATADAGDTSSDDKKPADAAKTDAAAVSTGAARPRVIDGQEVRIDEPAPCTVVVSQENISLINNGGSVGILVNLEGPGEIKTVTSISNSPKDIEVTLEPEIGGMPDRRFYVIRSISPAIGVYQVSFVAPCGKKEIIVNVR